MVLKRRTKPYSKFKSNQSNYELKKKRLEIIAGVLFLIGTIINYGLRYLESRKHHPPPAPQVQQQPDAKPNPPEVKEDEPKQTKRRTRIGRRKKTSPRNSSRNTNTAERANTPGLPRN